MTAWAENRYPSYIIASSPPPLYRDAPAAASIMDVRIKQQPLLLGSARPSSTTKSQFGADDLKFVLIVVGGVTAILLFASLMIGLVVYLCTKVCFFTLAFLAIISSLKCLYIFFLLSFHHKKETGTSILRFPVPMTTWRVEL